jgi:hypothetical protein
MTTKKGSSGKPDFAERGTPMRTSNCGALAAEKLREGCVTCGEASVATQRDAGTPSGWDATNPRNSARAYAARWARRRAHERSVAQAT